MAVLKTGRGRTTVAMDMQRDVLIIEGDLRGRDAIHGILEAAGYKCQLAEHGREGLEAFRRLRPALVVTALNTPLVGGRDLLQQIRQEDRDAAVIMLAGVADLKAAIAGLKLGAHAFVLKPVNTDELRIAAERALERRELLIEHRKHHPDHEPLHGAETRHTPRRGGPGRARRPSPDLRRRRLPVPTRQQRGGRARDVPRVAAATDHRRPRNANDEGLSK